MMKFFRRIGAIFEIFLAICGLAFSMFGNRSKSGSGGFRVTNGLTRILDVSDDLLVRQKMA